MISSSHIRQSQGDIHKVTNILSSSSFTDIHYIAKNLYHDEKMTRLQMSKLLYLFNILDTTHYDCKVAFDSAINDYEDALVEQISYENKLDYIVTRNIKDFKNSRVKVCTPNEFVKTIAAFNYSH